jgi:hypothetical protein
MNTKSKIIIYIASLCLDSISIAFIFLTPWVLRNSYRHAVFFLFVVFPLVIILISFLMQWKVSWIYRKYPFFKSSFIVSLRYAYIIPYSVFMIMTAVSIGSYLTISYMFISIFTVYSRINRVQQTHAPTRKKIWPYAVGMTLMLLLSIVASFLSIFTW